MPSAREIISRYSNLKTLPHVAIQLTRLISDPNSNAQEFEKVIKMDPVLVMRLVKLVNSPYYGLRQKVEDISRAVVLLGTKTLRNMVVTAALKEIFKGDSEEEEIFSRPGLWLHCASVGICCQMISERIFQRKGEDAFLCGILHDIGMIVENQVHEDLFLEACRQYQSEPKLFIEHEQDIIGTHHCKVGAALAKDWNLPDEIAEGVKYHHNGKKDVAPDSICGIVQLADYIIYKMNYTAIKDMRVPISGDIAGFLKSNMSEFKVLVRDLPVEVEKAKEIYEFKEE